MRKIVCEKHGKAQRTPDEDALRGLSTRYVRGVTKGSYICDVCNAPLPADIVPWESGYLEVQP